MQVYGSILPGAATLARLLPQLAAEGRAEVTLSRGAQCRLKVIRWHENQGRNVTRTADHFGYSRPTIYAWLKRYKRAGPKGLEDRSRRPQNLRKATWSTGLERRVLALREQYPRWGKDKLVVLLRRQGLVVSTSMVGRILGHLKDTGQLIEPLPQRRKSKKYPPRPYAIRKPKGYLAREPGDLVEVDTVDLRPLPGVVLKHFTARDVVSRWDVLGVYTRATANTAAQFLDALQERSPFPVKGIQVDGGSEFKADFEVLCQERGIRLFVLPPRSPKLNGCVERGNRTHREEFYEVYDLNWTVAELRPDLLAWENVYNTVRPHKSLGYLTPQEYVTQWRERQGRKEVV
jgi:transposase InsO family protein